MEPPFVTLRLPAAGLEWLPGQDSQGACDETPPGACVRKPLGSVDVMSCRVGPEGSGRYWTVTIGIASRPDPKPSRGVCFTTSTVAWRTLPDPGRTGLSPLRWLDDLDGDGEPEAIVWHSFRLREEAEQYESGLMAWVYRVDPAGVLALDWSLSRRMAGEIAGAYRLPPAGGATPGDRAWTPLRQAARAALDAFAARRCTASAEGARPSR
jgi:hypothetical protein